MAGSNGYKNLVKTRGARRKLDDYETPENVAAMLCAAVKFRGPIFEPAIGTGRLARALRKYTGLKVTGTDIKTGTDFLNRSKTWAGDLITNPPYRDGLADAFTTKALEVADGRVALLLELKFLTGEKRTRNLFWPNPPEIVIIHPGRIYFFEGAGDPIKSQFFNHAWVVWPERKYRGRIAPAQLLWGQPAPQNFDFG